MSWEPSKEELRAKEIHACLDNWAARIDEFDSQSFSHSYDGGKTWATFTRAEVIAWPSIKAALIARLNHWPERQFVFWNARCDSSDGWGSDSVKRSLDLATKNADAKDPVARGLYMTRAMLPAEQLAVVKNHGCLDCGDPVERHDIRCDECTRKFYRATVSGAVQVTFTCSASEFGRAVESELSKKLDPYTGHDIAADKLVAAKTFEHPQSVRARKLAALGEELRRKVEPRYPHEARSERTYASQNPRFK